MQSAVVCWLSWSETTMLLPEVLQSLPGAVGLSLGPFVAISVASLYCLWVFGLILYDLLLSPLRNVPGPFLTRFTRLWELWAFHHGDYHERLMALHEKYGRVIRLAPQKFSFNDPEDLKKIYAAGGGYAKSDFYHATSEPHRPTIFSLQDEKQHARRRRPIAQLYAMTTVHHYEEAVDLMNSVLTEKLGQFAAEKRQVSLPELCQFYAFDVIAQITWDESFNMMKNERDKTGLLSSVTGAVVSSTHIGLLPELHTPIFTLAQLFSSRGIGQLTGIVDNAIKTFRIKGSSPKTNPVSEPFLSKLIKLEADGKADASAFYDAASANITAGSDTTGITLSAAFYYLFTHPDTLAKLREEIDHLAKEGQLSDPATFSETQKMPYLQAVIKEVLRIHPAIGVVLSRVVPRGGAELGGYYFPHKTVVGCSAWPLHHNPGQIDQPEKFQPERWLDGSLSGNPAANFAFGGGSRTCLGKNVSLLEVSKVVPQVVRHFNLQFDAGSERLKTNSGFFVWPEYECWVERRG